MFDIICPYCGNLFSWNGHPPSYVPAHCENKDAKRFHLICPKPDCLCELVICLKLDDRKDEGNQTRTTNDKTDGRIQVPLYPSDLIEQISVGEIDLSRDRDILFKSDVDLIAVSPLKNAAMKKLVNLANRTMIVNLAGIENALKTENVEGQSSQIGEHEIKCDVTANADALAAKIKKLLQVEEGDDTNVQVLGGGKQLLVRVPLTRVEGAPEVAIRTIVKAATTEALVQQFKASTFDVHMLRAAVLDQYPLIFTMSRGNIDSVLKIRHNDERFDDTLRNVTPNHIVATTRKSL